MRKPVGLLGGVSVVVSVALALSAAADTIRLRSGSTLTVDAWRDAGDAIEAAVGGGIVRIDKRDVERVEGRATRGDLQMYSAPPGAAAAPSDRAEALKRMADLLKQGEGLAAQAILTAAEKAAVFKRLAEAWAGLPVPDALREAHARGQQALQLLADAYVAESGGTAPDAKERVDKARAEIQAAQDEIRKASEAS
jgi:hypothetical protein